MVKANPRPNKKALVGLKKRYRPITNIDYKKTDSTKSVSVRKGLKLPRFVKTYMETLTPGEITNIQMRRSEISSEYFVHFDKKSLKIDSPKLDEATKRVIEYAVRTNLKSLPVYQRKFVKNFWNGMIFVKIKKLVKPVVGQNAAYTIPWHRDSHVMEYMGKRYKAFIVGAIYVNRPKNITGGEIEFTRNSMRFSLAPPSGTSVTFFDEDVFHRVTPIKAPEGLEYVPRSAIFFAYASDTSSRTFKLGLKEGTGIGMNRNYEKFYRNTIPVWMKKVFNGAPLNASNIQQARVFYKRNNINPVTNLKPFIAQTSKAFFTNNSATYNNLKTLHNNLKGSFHKNVKPIYNKSFIINVKTRKRYPYTMKRRLKKISNALMNTTTRLTRMNIN